MTIIYQYRIYCIEEAKFVLTWGTVPPTLCPNDHGDRTISGEPIIVGTISESEVIANEPYNGYFTVESIEIDVPECSPPGGEHSKTINWPMNINLWNMEFLPKSNMLDDVLCVIASPDTTAGYITANASTNDTILNLSSTIVTNSNITRGVHIAIDGNPSGYQNLGRITNIDPDNNQITVENPLNGNYTAGDLLKISIYIINGLIIDYSDFVIRVGMKGFQGKPIPAGTPIKLVYKNNDGTAKKVRLKLEYYNSG